MTERFRFLSVFFGFCYLVFFPDFWIKFLNLTGFVTVGFGPDNIVMPGVRETYNFLYDVTETFALVLLLSQVRSLKFYYRFTLFLSPFIVICQLFIIHTYSQWLVFRGIELSREILFLILIYMIIKETPIKYQKIRFYWLSFFLIDAANFLMILNQKFLPVILRWDYLANHTAPIQAWLWLSVIFILSSLIYIWLRPILGLVNIQGESFTGGKNGLFIKPSKNVYSLWLAFLKRKEGGARIYLATNKKYYGISQKENKKGVYGYVTRPGLDFLFIPFDGQHDWYNTKEQAQKAIDVIEKKKLFGKQFSLHFFHCWTAANIAIKAATDKNYHSLLKRK